MMLFLTLIVFLEVYETQIDKLERYASTFGWAFDKEVETKSGEIVMIRGFVLEERKDNE